MVFHDNERFVTFSLQPSPELREGITIEVYFWPSPQKECVLCESLDIDAV